MKLARQYHLPRRLQDFILEHHGTGLANYQYARAIETAGGDESRGGQGEIPLPWPTAAFARETGLLMLADGTEARTRADRPKDEAELRALISSIVQARIDSGQLADTSLTLRDLQVVIDSFTATLKGVYHPRIQYPKMGNEIQTVPVKHQPPDPERESRG